MVDMNSSCVIVQLTTSLVKQPSTESIIITKKICGWRRHFGMLCALLATILFTLSAAINKKCSNIDVVTLWAWAFPVATIVSFIYLFYSIYFKKEDVMTNLWPVLDYKKNWAVLWLYALILSLVSYTLTSALQYISLADTRTIGSIAAVTVFFCGWLFLGEKLGIVPICMAFVAFVGVVIMMRPPIFMGSEQFSSNTLIGIAFATAWLLCRTSHVIMMRYLKNVHEGMINCVSYCWGTLVYLVVAVIFDKLQVPDSLLEIFYVVAVGALFSCGTLFVALALQREEAGVVSLIRTTDVIFAFVWQFVLIGVLPDLVSVIGALTVMTGVVTVTLRKWVASLKENDRRRQKLAWLLL